MSKRQSKQASTDTNTPAKYEVTLHYTQYSRALVIIEAESLAVAEALADEIQPDEVVNWNPVDGDIDVESVEPASEGGSDE